MIVPKNWPKLSKKNGWIQSIKSNSIINNLYLFTFDILDTK